jgi:hypothetical protein
MWRTCRAFGKEPPGPTCPIRKAQGGGSSTFTKAATPKDPQPCSYTAAFWIRILHFLLLLELICFHFVIASVPWPRPPSAYSSESRRRPTYVRLRSFAVNCLLRQHIFFISHILASAAPRFSCLSGVCCLTAGHGHSEYVHLLLPILNKSSLHLHCPRRRDLFTTHNYT